MFHLLSLFYCSYLCSRSFLLLFAHHCLLSLALANSRLLYGSLWRYFCGSWLQIFELLLKATNFKLYVSFYPPFSICLVNWRGLIIFWLSLGLTDPWLLLLFSGSYTHAPYVIRPTFHIHLISMTNGRLIQITGRRASKTPRVVVSLSL